MRVCIVGPVSPIRGGIARHTTALSRELFSRDDIDIRVISFKRQHPAFLYPGEAQFDPQAEPLAAAGVDVRQIIDSINPLTWRTALADMRALRPDLVIMPAWTFFLAPCLGWLARAIRQYAPVVMIVHNARDHEAASWKSACSTFQLRQADAFVTHNAGVRDDLSELVPATVTEIHAHPVYDDYPEPMGTLPREASVELLFFGLVRPYKGLDLALGALADAGRDDIRFTVVGEFWHGRQETEALIDDLGLADSVVLVPRYVSDQEAAEYFARADWVIAPYYSATGSGVIALAQWYLRPVIASNVRGLAEAISDGATGLLFPAADQGALSEILRDKVTRPSAAGMESAIRAVREDLSWRLFADTVLDIGRQVGSDCSTRRMSARNALGTN